MAKEDQKKKLAGFADLLKTTPQAPIQEVRPVKEVVVEALKEKEKQLNVTIPESLNKRLKVYAATNEINVKEIVALAIESYLNNKIET